MTTATGNVHTSAASQEYRSTTTGMFVFGTLITLSGVWAAVAYKAFAVLLIGILGLDPKNGSMQEIDMAYNFAFGVGTIVALAGALLVILAFARVRRA